MKGEDEGRMNGTMPTTKEFRIGDIVRLDDDRLYVVTGVIHDDEELYVTDHTCVINDGREFLVRFSDVETQWHEVIVDREEE